MGLYQGVGEYRYQLFQIKGAVIMTVYLERCKGQGML